ncbi:hypothetical protein COL154_006215 [Colletotrichum chrysophilum]|nr:hypothetical protein COL154_006215 [Colletotrichum chrysophilum]
MLSASSEQWEAGFAPINTGKNNGDSSDDNATLSSPTRDTHRDTMMIEEEDRRELQRIATTLSRRQSGVSFGEPQLSNIATNDPSLDPTSKSFDLSKWLQRIMQQMSNEGISIKKAGVAYKDLNVSGTGAALQLQQTVGSFLAAPLRIGEHLSFGKKEPKRILHNFDGLLNSGELLIVLGRPGSGCSTLLKTMTGELHGLSLGHDSVIHYNGIPQKRMVKEFKGETVYNQEVRNFIGHLICDI